MSLDWIPSVEDCINFRDFQNDHWKACDIARSTNASLEQLEEMIDFDWRGYSYRVRSAIAENPNISEELINKLSLVADGREEWAALYRYWINRYGCKQGTWDIEVEFGFPDKLLISKLENDEIRNGLILEIIPCFTEHLWHDLASKKLIDLVYWADSAEGDVFGPLNWVGISNERLIGQLLGRGYFTSWISKDGSVDFAFGLEQVANDYEDYFADKIWLDEDPDDSGFTDSLLLNAVAIGLEAHFSITEIGKVKIDEILQEVLSGDETLLDFEIEITGEPRWVGKKWSELNPVEQSNFVGNLLSSLSHSLLGGFGLIEHILALIAIHPDTDKAVVETIEKTGLQYVELALADKAKAK